MYDGMNPTALKSRGWIVDALIQLMQEKPYSQVTIIDICRRADLSRQTFYNIFETKEEILRYCLRQKYEEQFLKISKEEHITCQNIIEALISVLQEDKEILQLMIDNHLDSIVSEEIAKCIAMFAGRFVKEDERNERLPYAEATLAGALSSLLLYWFRQEKKISLEQLTDLFADFLSGRLYRL